MEVQMNATQFLAATMLIVGSGLPPQAMLAQETRHPATPVAEAMPGTKRIDLQQHDLGTTGREAIQVRVDFEPGAAFGRHTHHGEEIIYVLEGSLEYQVDGKSPVTLKAGDVFFIPAGTVHAARNVGSSAAAELATYVVEKGKPLVTLVE
jgi:quercetin dioxygenase-like cupin family protein